jgi:hypothetical protein
MDVAVEEKKGPAALEKFGFKKKDGAGPTPVEAGSPVKKDTGSSPKKSSSSSSPAKKVGSSPAKAKAKGTLESFGFGK